MKVTFNDILDRTYSTLVTDYKLDNLIKLDEDAFYSFLGGFLVNSIDKFDGCLSDLSYHTEEISVVNEDTAETEIKTIYVFDNALSNKEIYLLCLGVAIGWYKKSLDDVTQFGLHLNTKNFKSHSEQQNLQRRLERLNVMEEEFDRQINNYQLDNLNKIPFFGGN